MQQVFQHCEQPNKCLEIDGFTSGWNGYILFSYRNTEQHNASRKTSPTTALS